MKDHVLVSVRLLVVFTLLLGFGYPAAVWAVGWVAFPNAAGGSFLSRDGAVVGSALIGQAVASPGLFRTPHRGPLPRPVRRATGERASPEPGRSRQARSFPAAVLLTLTIGLVPRAPNDRRPDPEAFLRRASRDARLGKLKVYLGMAAGVGKTYKMLDDAHALRRHGTDVVVGYVESHGRSETEARIADLEVVPRKQVSYQGVVLPEMDLDAILRRRPDAVVVDELAHTNAPGMTLGATVVVREAEDAASEILRFVREENVAVLIVGPPSRRGVLARLLPGIVDRLLARAIGFDLLVADAGGDEEP